MRAWVGILALVGCGAAEGEVDPTTPAPPTTGGSSDGEPPIAATCAVDEGNGLRAVCAVQLATPGPASITLSAPGIDPLVFDSPAAAAAHAIPVWGLAPSTSFAWVATAGAATASGVLETGALVGTLRNLTVTVTATGDHGDEAVLLNYGCEGLDEALLILDRAGRVRWYEELLGIDDPGLGPTTTRGFQVDADGTLLALLDRDAVVSYDRLGGQSFVAARDADFVPPVHHDVARWGQWTYALFSEVVDGPLGPTVMDGFLVFAEDGSVRATWRAADHFAPVAGGTGGGPYWADVHGDALDWSHTNAIAVDALGHATLSLRYQSALVQVVADPDAADFGAVRWVAVGEPATSALVATVPLWSSTGITDLGFEEQHHLTALGDGAWLLWDNGRDGQPSRALRVQETDVGLDLQQEWVADGACPGQGSASLLASGHVLVDCAPADTLAEVTPAGETVWSARVGCGIGLMLRPLYRGLPVALFPERP
jgi:hypothetical protein